MKKGKLSELEWKERYTYTKSVPFTQEDLNCPGTKFQIVRFAPGSSIEPHSHSRTHEIFYIQGGSGTIIMNGKEIPCSADDFFLCRPGDSHAFKNSGNEDLVILIFKTNEVDGDMHWDAK
jgi:mannose-6-phosphate isomerase-like protein (cupin superfamily)